MGTEFDVATDKIAARIDHIALLDYHIIRFINPFVLIGIRSGSVFVTGGSLYIIMLAIISFHRFLAPMRPFGLIARQIQRTSHKRSVLDS